MIRKTLLISMIITTVLVACSTKKSRVTSFEYGGHYDTSCAILQGEIYEPNSIQNSKDSLLPILNAMIKSVDSSNKIYKTSFTDSKGKFFMSFFNNGVYNLVVSKNGYKTIRVTNFIADSGQTSSVKIILEKEQKIF